MDYDQMEDQARKLAAAAKDGRVTVDGETYTLIFDREAWHYKVYAPNGDLIAQLNTRKLSVAKGWVRA